MTHENSIKVKIHRASSFLGRAQGPDVQAFMGYSKASIGSYFASGNSKKIGSGLDYEEEELLLPEFLDVNAAHPEFRNKVSQFYIDLDTQVPFGDGLELEIGLKESNSKPVSKENRPIDSMNYLRYRHAINHPYVAKTKEEADSNPQKQFYIFNPMELDKKQQAKNDERDAATQIFLEIKGQPEKVKMMLTLLGTNIKEFSGKNASQQMSDALRKLSETKPGIFVSTFRKKDIELEFLVQRMVDTKILKMIAGKYYDTEALDPTKSLLASSTEEMVHFFKDPDHSKEAITYRARLQEKETETLK